MAGLSGPWWRRRGRTTLGALLGFALAAAALSPSLFGRKAFLPADIWWRSQPWLGGVPPAIRRFPTNELLTDQAILYAPQLWVARESLRGGGRLLWNPYFRCGEPLLGAGLSGPLAPTNLPVLLLPWPDGFAWSALLRFGTMWMGAFLLGLRLGLGGAWSLALAVGFCFAPAYILHFQQPRAAINPWLPWLLLGVERIAAADARGARALVRAALPVPLLVLAVLLGGHPPSAFIALFGVALYAAVRLPVRSSRGALGARLVTAAAFVVGAALAAPATLPFVESLRDSVTLAERADYGSRVLDPKVYRLFWDPFALGSHLPGSPKPWIGSTNFEEEQQYVGLLPWVFLLGCAPLALRRRSPDRSRFTALAVLVLVSGALVYGWAPLHAWLTSLPPFSFNSNPRFSILVQASLLLAAALAARRWLDPPARPAPRAAAWLLGAAALGATALLVLGAPESARPWVALGSAVALFSGGRLGGTPRVRAAAAALVPLLLFADLAPLHRRYHPQVPRAWADPGIARARLPAELRSDPALRLGPGWVGPNLLALLGAVDVLAYSLPMPRRYDLYMRHVAGLAEPTALGPADLMRPEVFAAVERSCATWLVSSLAQGEALAEKLSPVSRYGGVRFDRFAASPPWAGWYRAESVTLVPGLSEATQAVRAGLASAPEPIVLEDAPPGRTARAAPEPGLAAQARHATSDRIEIEVPPSARDRAGYVVVRTSYDRGWRAFSQEGAPLRVLPAQVRFLAVETPPGTARIVLDYLPPHAGASLLALLAGLSALAAAAAFSARRSSRKRAQGRGSPSRTAPSRQSRIT